MDSIHQTHVLSVRRFLSVCLAIIFSISTVTSSYAQPTPLSDLSILGTTIDFNTTFVPVLLKGMTVYPEDPLKFSFVVDSGDTHFTDDKVREESDKLIKYFLAGMTVPDDSLWVNLSPVEPDRVIPSALGQTELGRDMLSQDYILKQITASLMNPDGELGNKFWDSIYQQAQEKFGIVEIPVDTFNKVWIVPESANVYESGSTVYIMNSRLKVMLEEDYSVSRGKQNANDQISDTKQIIKDIILPAIEREVNEGESFASLRQIYHSLILAKWYKQTVKAGVLSQVYIDQNKISGIELADLKAKDQIYQQYIKAFQKGSFNVIKEDYDSVTQQVVPRQYFSGGEKLGIIPLHRAQGRSVFKASAVGQSYNLSMQMEPKRLGTNFAMLDKEKPQAIVFGIGAMSRGYVGDILEQSGFKMTFVEDNEEMVDKINKGQGYTLILTDPANKDALIMKKITADAQMLTDKKIGSKLKSADLIFVANLSQDFVSVSKVIASALNERVETDDGENHSDEPLMTIIVVSNQIGAARIIRHHILESIPEKNLEAAKNVLKVLDSVSDRIVPSLSRNHLAVIDHLEDDDEDVVFTEKTEDFMDVEQVNSESVRLLLRKVNGIKMVNNIGLLKRKKLFTVNMAHSMAAYLGALWGYESISDAMKNLEIRGKVEKTLKAIFMLHQTEWQVDPQTMTLKILSRFENEKLYDQITRVARSPLSKLGQNERLVGVALEFIRHNIPIDDIAESIAAAIIYYQNGQTLILQDMEEVRRSVEKFILKESGWKEKEHEKLISKIIEQYERLLEIRNLAEQFVRIGMNAEQWEDAVQVEGRNVFVVKAPASVQNLSEDMSLDSGLYEMFVNGEAFHVTNPEEEKECRMFFSELVRTGKMKPKIIVHIKDLFPEAVALYIKELIHISKSYNGNLTFVLVKEELGEFRNDFPSTFSADQKAVGMVKDLQENEPIIHIADGGRKVRNAISVLPYGFQGLLPYSVDKTYVHEELLRIGVLLLQLPTHGNNLHIIAPSDSLFKFTNTNLLNGLSLSSWDSSEHGLLLALSPTNRENISSKVIAETGGDHQIQQFLAKPSEEFFKERSVPGSKLWTVPFLLIWDKTFLDGFMREMTSALMEDGRSTLQMPADFFLAVIEGVFIKDDRDWLNRKPSHAISDKDWIRMRQLAMDYLGNHGQRLEFMQLKQDGFHDDGHIVRYKNRIEQNFKDTSIRNVAKYPSVKIYGAEDLKGGNIVIKGAQGSKLHIGKGVTLNNVLIDLGEGGELTIPDNWVITDSYLGSGTMFNGKDGFLNSVFQVDFQNDRLAPVVEDFQGSAGSTIVMLKKASDKEMEQIIAVLISRRPVHTVEQPWL